MKNNIYMELSKRPEGVLTGMTLFGLLVPNVLLCFTEGLSAFGCIANILLPAGLYILLIAGSRNVGRNVLLSFPFMFLGAFQTVLLGLYGHGIIAVDMFLNVVTTNAGEVGELLGNLAGSIALVCLLYLPCIGYAIFILCRKGRLTSEETRFGRRVGVTLASLGATAMLIAMATGNYSPGDDLFPANVVRNMAIAADREAKVKHYAETSAGFNYDAVATHDAKEKEIYVLVVGETSRAGSWQLAGYKRATNPKLWKRQNRIVMFDRAMSESNTTHKSVPLLLSPLTSDEFDSIYSVKGIISAFKEAGFATAYISNQERNHGIIDDFGEEADTCLFIKDHPELYSNAVNDLVMNDPIDRVIHEAADRQLIVVHCYGSHFNYTDRYDDRHRKFLPDHAQEISAGYRKSLVNAYDNTILMTDDFIDRVIASLEKSNTRSALLYAADHGEDIFDDDRNLFLHASPRPSFYQLHVPFFAWVSAPYEHEYPEIVRAMRDNRHKDVSTSASYFHTALDLAGVTTHEYKGTLSVASGKFEERPRTYLNDHNLQVSLNDAGFDPLDFRHMRQQLAIGKR